MATKTPYLNLQYISVGNTAWLSTYESNLVKLDAIGKNLRMQTAAGKSMALRAELSNGSLVDAIRIVPDPLGTSLVVYIGRQGKGDRVIIDSSSIFPSINLSNQNVLASDKACSIGVTWMDEDGVGGDPVQDTTVIMDVRNNKKTTIVFPPASPTLVTNPNNYLGSALQLGTDPLGTGVGTPHLRFICETTTGTRVFLVPAYSL